MFQYLNLLYCGQLLRWNYRHIYVQANTLLQEELQWYSQLKYCNLVLIKRQYTWTLYVYIYNTLNDYLNPWTLYVYIYNNVNDYLNPWTLYVYIYNIVNDYLNPWTLNNSKKKFWVDIPVTRDLFLFGLIFKFVL